MTTTYARLRWTAALLAVPMVIAAALTAPAASAAGTGSISGVVVDDAGVAVSGLSVGVYSLGGAELQAVLTGDDGEYLVTGLGAGEYRVLFNTDPPNPLLSEWYDGAKTAAGATPLTVVDGGTTIADATLQAAATLSGTVTGYDTLAPIAEVSVELFEQTETGDAWVGEATTDADGRYLLPDIWPGTYRVQFTPDPSFGLFSTPFFSVAEGASLTDIDAELETAGVVSGTVTDPDGDPVNQAQVVVYLAAGGGEIARATTNEGGEYEVSGLDGEFVVQFLAPTDSDLAGQWWDGASTREEATLISLSHSSARGVDAQLEPGLSISGTATSGFGGVGDVTVYAYPASCDLTVQTATARTEADGSYRLTGLAAGTYRVRVGDEATIGYTPRWWGGAKTCASSTAVTIGATPVTGVDAFLGETISGKVVGVSSAALAGVSVQAVPVSDESALPVSVLTTSTGAFALRGLPAGSYRIAFGRTARPGTYVPEWWKDAVSAASSTPVTVTAGATPPAISATLSLTPVTLSTPKITGTPRVGVKLTASAAPAGITYAYRWSAGGTAISGATSRTFTPGAAQRGKTITVRVTASRSGYASASKTSAATSAVRTGVLVTATPRISGTAKVGKKLSVSRGTWTSGTTFTYRWYAGGTAIRGATSSTLTLTKAQKGKTITVKVTGKKSGYTTVTRTSKATAKVG